MRQDVQKYITGCPSCQINKLTQPRVSTGIPGRAFERIRLDLIGFTPHELAYGTLSNPSPPHKLPVLRTNETYNQHMRNSQFRIKEVQPPMHNNCISVRDPSGPRHSREKRDPVRSSGKYLGNKNQQRIRESVSRNKMYLSNKDENNF